MPKYGSHGKKNDHSSRPSGGKVTRRGVSEKRATSSSTGVAVGGTFRGASSNPNAPLLTDKGMMQRMFSTTRAEISRQVQQAYGNRYVQRLFSRLERAQAPVVSRGSVQRDWVGTENSSLSDTSARNLRALKDLVSEITRIPGSAGTIAPREGSTNLRIDMQGAVPREDESWANIQCQVGGDSIAGVICPFELDLEDVKRGLLQALEAGDILEWEVGEAAEVDDELAQWVESETADAPPIELPRGMKSPPYH